MLDFYFIPDNQPKPDYPDGDLAFAGGLDDRVFSNLQKKGIIDEHFDYYSDFRWNESILKQIRNRIDEKQIPADTDILKLLHLIDAALGKKVGLIAYGD